MTTRVGACPGPCLLLVEVAKVDVIRLVCRHVQAHARCRDVRHGSKPEFVPAPSRGAALPDASSIHSSGLSLIVANS